MEVFVTFFFRVPHSVLTQRRASWVGLGWVGLGWGGIKNGSLFDFHSKLSCGPVGRHPVRELCIAPKLLSQGEPVKEIASPRSAPAVDQSKRRKKIHRGKRERERER